MCNFSEQARARRERNKESRKRKEERATIKKREMLRRVSESEKVEQK